MIIWNLVLTPELPKPGHYTGPGASAPEGLSLQMAQVPSHLQGPSARWRETQAGLWLWTCPKTIHCPQSVPSLYFGEGGLEQVRI